LAACCGLGAQASIKVAAASDLSAAFEEVGKALAKQGPAPVFSFGSSGLLAKQLTQGAPFDVFAAAHVSYVDEVLKAGVGDPSTKALFARGRLVVWVPKGKDTPRNLKDLATSPYVKIAIANPEHAPFGKAAVQALTSAGVYEQVKAKLVFGENVRQALQYGLSGNADASIVSLSHVLTSPGTFYEVPTELFQPIDLAIVVCSRNPEARRFVQFVGSEPGRAILRRFGYLFPQEAKRP
jgi:molybdate transport system substrate-binding protein